MKSKSWGLIMSKFIKDILTGIDGQSYDLGRVLLTLGCLTMIFGAGKIIWTGSLDFVAFGAGFGGLLVGGGGLLALKRQTEPQTKVTSISDDAQTVVESKS
jgi:hypothetical protein